MFIINLIIFKPNQKLLTFKPELFNVYWIHNTFFTTINRLIAHTLPNFVIGTILNS